MNETSILPFCANHQFKWNVINKNGEVFARIVGSIDFEDDEFVNWLSLYN